ncbi:unnamed protein product [Linum trigynum]|uniref:Uncharacterized protein n=1 Tax=Linum trigynum TaxID=586398 RepID=A0AAV2DZ77_9ROSI
MLRTVEVRWLEQGNGWTRAVVGGDVAVGAGLQGAACDDGGEQKQRWRLAMALLAAIASCLRQERGEEATMATGDGDWRWRAACGDNLLAAATCLQRQDGSAGGLGRWLTAAGWRHSPSVVCSTSRSKMEK